MSRSFHGIASSTFALVALRSIGITGDLSLASGTVTAVGAEAKTYDVVFKSVGRAPQAMGPMAAHSLESWLDPDCSHGMSEVPVTRG